MTLSIAAWDEKTGVSRQSHLSGERESDAAVTNASAILSSAEKLVASTQHQPEAPGDKPLEEPK